MRRRPGALEQGLEDRSLEVDGDTLTRDDRRRRGSMARVCQHARDVVHGEVNRYELDVAGFDAESLEPRPLVALRVRVVDLEPPDTRLRVPEGSSVVARGHDDHLWHARVQCSHDDPIEERRPRREIRGHARGGFATSAATSRASRSSAAGSPYGAASRSNGDGAQPPAAAVIDACPSFTPYLSCARPRRARPVVRRMRQQWRLARVGTLDAWPARPWPTTRARCTSTR